jgi:phosphonate metabolism protein (transferase hexapeptide repeat family)
MKRVNHRPDCAANDDLLPRLGDAPWIHPTARVVDCRIGCWVEIGAFAAVIQSHLDDYSYVAGSCTEILYTRISKFVSIASHVRINPSNHPMQRVTQHHCTYRRRQYGFGQTDDADIFEWRKKNAVTIAPDVWIGHGAILLPGVTVNTGAVIAAGAVVTKPVDPYQIVAGVPAKEIGRRFAPGTAERLMATRWWDWDHATLKRRFEDLLDVDRFLEKYAS